MLFLNGVRFALVARAPQGGSAVSSPSRPIAWFLLARGARHQDCTQARAQPKGRDKGERSIDMKPRGFNRTGRMLEIAGNCGGESGTMATERRESVTI